MNHPSHTKDFDCRMERSRTLSLLSQAAVVKGENPDTKRGPWNQREDQELLDLVKDCGPHNWVDISTRIRHRTPKQCRERYHQNLKPTLNHTPISYEEGLEIIRHFNELGPKWAEIARHLQGRSDNSIKNWWNGSVNRRRRQEQHERKKHESNGRRPQPRGPINGQLRSMVYGLPDQRPLPTLFIPNHHHYVPPLESPARSESTGEAPSLVSDNSAHSTPSPKTLSSPPIHLPPMVTMNEDTRRSNLVQLHTSSTSLDYNPSRITSNDRQPLSSLNREHYDCFQKPSSVSGTSYRGTASEPASANSYSAAAFSSQQGTPRAPEPGPPCSYRFLSFDDTRRASRVEEPLSPRSCTLPPIHGFPNSVNSATSLLSNPHTITNVDNLTNQPESPDASSKVSVKSLLC